MIQPVVILPSNNSGYWSVTGMKGAQEFIFRIPENDNTKQKVELKLVKVGD